MPRRIEVTPTTTTGLVVEKFVLPDLLYMQAEEQAKAEGHADLNQALKAYVKLLIRTWRENQKRAEVQTADLDTL